ncbi:DUF3331 domain-containing protein [Paraburkholderia caribensis]|uniref:DUF3331 domain-containing protein n=1 Tax=Paraburkholderia caribensis TaxID=75105 RepID=UPI0034D35275
MLRHRSYEVEQFYPALRFVERTADSEATFSWQDPALGRMTDQRWKAGKARYEGVCALTGVSIRRGDRVFKPFGLRRETPNHEQMVHVDALGDPDPKIT